jgi:hypothetical protein
MTFSDYIGTAIILIVAVGTYVTFFKIEFAITFYIKVYPSKAYY